MRTVLWLALWATPAWASQVHPHEVELAELVQGSELIVVAEPVGEPKIQRQTFKSKAGKKVPPYEFQTRRWKITSILKAPAKPMPTITVRPAHTATMLRLHLKYYEEGISKSPILDHYSPKTPIPEGPRILFLRSSDRHFELVASGAMESLEQKEVVLDMLRKEK